MQIVQVSKTQKLNHLRLTTKIAHASNNSQHNSDLSAIFSPTLVWIRMAMIHAAMAGHAHTACGITSITAIAGTLLDLHARRSTLGQELLCHALTHVKRCDVYVHKPTE